MAYSGKNMLGLVFGRLLVVEEAETHPSYGRRWVVRCTCGKSKVVLGSSLRNGKTTTCGVCGHLTHGMSKTPTYSTWKAMVERCTASTSKDWPRYGAIGITVCDSWLRFENFLADMGERPSGTSLDRIDGALGYCKENCRWATPKEQSLNTKSVKLFEFNGVTDSIKGWARRIGISDVSMAKRLRKWSLEKALTTPRTESKIFGN